MIRSRRGKVALVKVSDNRAAWENPPLGLFYVGGALRHDGYAVGEDFFTSMNAAMEGFRTVFVPRAVAHELIVETDQNLLKTKVRIISKDLRGLTMSCHPEPNPLPSLRLGIDLP